MPRVVQHCTPRTVCFRYKFVQQLREPTLDGAANAELARLMAEDNAKYKKQIAQFTKAATVVAKSSPFFLVDASF